MIKYVNNSFHALKVSYTNEIAAVCKEVGIDSKKLMSLFCEDTQLNISPYYFKPGKAYGGRCLPKDLSVLQRNIERLNINCPVIKSISKSNGIQEKRDDYLKSKRLK
jgi:GDP-mannose 6-dehydrogenase